MLNLIIHIKRTDVTANHAPHQINGSQVRTVNTGDSDQPQSLFPTIRAIEEKTDKKINLCMKRTT